MANGLRALGFIALFSGMGMLPLMGGTARQRPTVVKVHDTAGLRKAVVNAKPGTNILVAPGEYSGGLYFSDLHGAPNDPITILAADPKNPPVFRGGTECLHFSDVSYLQLHGLVLVGATFGSKIDFNSRWLASGFSPRYIQETKATGATNRQYSPNHRNCNR